MMTSAGVTAATEALQAMERLRLQVKKDMAATDPAHIVFQKCTESLDNLREVKSILEGSEVKVTAPEIDEAPLQELKQLTLMHLPTSVTEDVRKTLKNLIFKCFEEEEVTILYAALITCPWYAMSQRERGEQAKHNQLFIVYQSTIDRFISPVNSHMLDQTNVVDKEWMYASELYHFVHFISKGRTRSVEALFCPQEAILYQADNWSTLRDNLHYTQVCGLRTFLEACRGQSVGGIGKKGKDGTLRMKDATTFRELCDSFRLMHHWYNTLHGQPPSTGEIVVGIGSTSDVLICKAIAILQSIYQNQDVPKKDAFTVLCKIKDEVERDTKTFTYTKPCDVEGIVGAWHMDMRLMGRSITPLRCPEDERSGLLSLMESIGGPVSQFVPEQIVMITQAGSYMYGLSTPTSDVDYVIIYAETTQTILTSCRRLSEIVENRGPQKQIEYGAYEARCFAEMVLKCSVVILELIFKDDHNYMSPAWKALTSHKDMFVVEKAVQQYMGLIKNNIKMIQSNKHKDLPQERKLFYQIYHKMYSLEYFLNGRPPPVKCVGPIRDFILRVRTAPLEGDLHRDNLYKDVMDKFGKLQSQFAHRRTRLPENCDFDFIVDWLLTVRGISWK